MKKILFVSITALFLSACAAPRPSPTSETGLGQAASEVVMQIESKLATLNGQIEKPDMTSSSMALADEIVKLTEDAKKVGPTGLRSLSEFDQKEKIKAFNGWFDSIARGMREATDSLKSKDYDIAREYAKRAGDFIKGARKDGLIR